MPKMRLRPRSYSGCNRNKNKAPRLLRLGVLDIACNLYLRTYTYNPRSYQHQDQVKNPQRSRVPELRTPLESKLI